MAIIKKTELKKMDEASIKSKLTDLQRQMIKINSQISTRTIPENPGRVKEIKRTIAKLKTRLSQIKKAGNKISLEVKQK
ncbi:MAG: 50S ribosomal protein L29 [Candidatus Woesearchaeota archaeon]|nr:MAG: 50S ribosomal protein L29 [Candidatus Woesearchaeota archaeon]